MTPSPPALRVVAIMAAAAVLALAVGLFPARPATADSTEPSPAASGAEAPAEDCGLLCLPIFDGGARPTEAETARQTKPPAGPAQPGSPAAEVPAGTEQPPAAPETLPTGTPVPSAPEEAAPDGPHTETATTGAGAIPSSGRTSTSTWDTPATRSARASQAAALTPAAGSGPGGPRLLPIAAGMLLVGAGAGAFIWWGRNRLRTH